MINVIKQMSKQMSMQAVTLQILRQEPGQVAAFASQGVLPRLYRRGAELVSLWALRISSQLCRGLLGSPLVKAGEEGALLACSCLEDTSVGAKLPGMLPVSSEYCLLWWASIAHKARPASSTVHWLDCASVSDTWLELEADRCVYQLLQRLR